jgi:hypothetical protein
VKHAAESTATEHLHAVRRALRDARWGVARKCTQRALADGLSARALKPAFAAAGKLELLVRLLWRHRDDVFKDVGTLAFFAGLVAETELAEEYFSKLRQWTPPSVSRQPTFNYPDCLTAFLNLDERVLVALFRLKYGGWDPGFPGDALENAAQHVDSIHIAPETAEFYYTHRRDTDMEFPAWLREVKIAQMLHHVFSDAAVVPQFHRDPDPQVRDMAARFCRMASFQEYVDVEEARRLFESLDLSNGLLVSTFHGGFLRISNFFYTTFVPDPYWLTVKGGRQPNVIAASDNERAAAFQIYKALTQGKAVLLAADGFHFGGSGGATVEVLGLKTRISEGSAWLAYESNCNTGWISASRRGNMFVPDYAPGPRRLPGESYGAFRERWVSFYTEQVQRALSLGPENLVLIARWGLPHSQLWS